ncbi:MAG: hypothetical protein M3Q07_18710 [Pseudobdellovibrionaceae bacterium]|nr:hypothetical protein [Pseudobdellovibrionaceae bacterium]
MKKFAILVTALALGPSMISCNKDKDDKTGATPGANTNPTVDPRLVEGVLNIGGVELHLPEYIASQSKSLAADDTHASRFDVELRSEKGTDKSLTSMDWIMTVKACDAVAFSKEFAEQIPAKRPDNIPESIRADTSEFRSWTTDTENYKGRVFLTKRYDSGEETPYFIVNSLFANEKSSVCVMGSLVITPSSKTSSEFIRTSQEFKAFEDGFARTLEKLSLKY